MADLFDDIGIEISLEDFYDKVIQFSEFLDPSAQYDVETAIELVRCWNTIEHFRLQPTDPAYQNFDVQYMEHQLENTVEILDASLVRGLGYYSEKHDIYIGGIPHQNSQYKVGARQSTGGISGHTLDVTYTVDDCEKCKGGIQVIQIFWGTRRTDGKQVGDKVVQSNGKGYDTFVDGGKNSPYVKWGGNPPAHPSKPYYLTPQEVQDQVKDCKVRIYDRPGAIVVHEDGYFETAIICIDYEGSGKDKIIKAFKWGWTGKGRNYRTSPGSGGKTSGLEEYDHVSQPFKDTLKHDYPGYEFTEN